MRTLLTLAYRDLKLVRRDPLLRWMLLVPFVYGALFGYLIPVVENLLYERLAFDLRPYHPLLMSYLFCLTIPILIGMVTGFLLLDERDEGTLAALQVTPPSLGGYLARRLALPSLLSIVLTMTVVPAMSPVETGFLALLFIGVLGALEAPIFALALASFAENKVTGLTLAKGSGVILLVPIGGYFLPEDWQLLTGIVPTYWPTKIFWIAHKGIGKWWPYFLAGLAWHTFLLNTLFQHFKAGRTGGQ